MKNRASLGLSVIVCLAALAASGCGIIDGLKARSHLNDGVSAYKAKEYEEAVKQFQQAVELDPELVEARLYLAHSYRIQYIPGVPRESNVARARNAIEVFKEVVETAPEEKADLKENAMASIAGLYDALGEEEEAKEWFRRRIEADPENPEPYYGIGTVNYQMATNLTGDKGSNVEELSEEEKEKAGEYVAEGIEALNKARELNPEYADALEYLNLLYREKSYLAQDEEEKERWEREASKLALEALQLRRKQQEEEERKGFFGKQEDTDS